MFQPQPFGKYYLFDKLAVGGMAEIFLAKVQAQLESSRFLVIKRILPHFSDNAQFVDMFIDEAKISAQLRHANIVPVHDLGKIGDSFFLAMEWIPGQDLKNIVNRCKDRGLRLSFEHAAFIVSELLKGLDYAHRKTDPQGRPLNIVHRDISPQNVLVGYDGQVKILDFGIAKAESKLDSTQVGTLKGKFGYMAPEQVVSSGPPLDYRADLFATGVILWELLTGMRLFSGTNEIEILERVRSARIDPPSTFAADVPRELEKVVFRALMKDREKRYASGAEMSQDLARFLAAYAPNFTHAEMSSAMKELFAPEIATIKQKWNVTIVDVGHADEGARLEASLVDARPVNQTPRPMPTPPRTPPPMKSPPPEPRITTARTTIQTPLHPPGKGNLQNELFGDFEATSPFAEEEAEQTTTTRTPSGGTHTDTFSKPIGPVTAVESLEQELEPEPEPDVSTQRLVRQPMATRTGPAVEVIAPPRRRAGRAFLGVVFLAVIVAAAAAWWQRGNPFAPPMIEVSSTVDAVVRIDGNIVLAMGSGGKWPVGAGDRVVEVSRAGYQPLVRTVTAAKGKTAFVAAKLEPLPNALAETPIETDPPGARVWLDDVEQEGVTPLVVRAKMGDHKLMVTLDGYQDQILPLRANHPGPAMPVKVVLVSSAMPPATAAVTEGTPAPVATATAEAPIPAPATATPLAEATAVPAATPTARRNRGVLVPANAPPDVQDEIAGGNAGSRIAAAGNRGFLSVEVPNGWGEVWIDGLRVGQRTPLQNVSVAAGTRTVRVVNPQTGKERTIDVEIKAGHSTTQMVPLD